MSQYGFYDPASGLLLDQIFEGSHEALEKNTPPGVIPIEGVSDPLAQRIDLKTGALIDYVPPQPSGEHEWNAETKRWAKKPEVLEAEARAKQSKQRIADLELNQLRPMRELLLNGNEQARQKLTEIDTAIMALRESRLP